MFKFLYNPFLFPVFFFQSSSSFLTYSLMTPKKQFALLTIPNTDAVHAPPERHTWALHHIVKDDAFWYNVAKGFTGTCTPFEDRSSNSSAESEGHRTLYSDNNEGKGVVIPLTLAFA